MHLLEHFTEKKVASFTEFDIFHPVPPSGPEVLYFIHLQRPLEYLQYLQFLDFEYLLMLS